MEVNQYLFHAYYKACSGKWYQPGVVGELSELEALDLERRGLVKRIKTAALEIPETRGLANVKRKIPRKRGGRDKRISGE